MLLEIRDMTVHYGKSMAIQGVSLGVVEGAVVSIIGANGAGKSTILRALSGLVASSSGEVWFRGDRIDGRETTEIVRLGISLVPEGRQLFPYLSVLSNLRLGASLRKDKGEIEESLEEVYKLFPRLQERRNQKAGTLSGGEQQMLAIGRGLMARPKLLCMDEPSLGLAPILVEQLGEVIRDINKRGASVLLVEQNVHLALGVASRAYALQVGRVVLEGDIETMKSSDIVKRAYLGG
ncbi:MAG: ABC transporter ATP-binding protein [Thermodesulfobacteriota bacterium]|jgi:branched-chain amino acid transport system ATP-binding protein